MTENATKEKEEWTLEDYRNEDNYMPEEREKLLKHADQIMENAVEVAGQMMANKPHVAEIILRQLLRCDPEHLGGLQILGLCKHRMGQSAEAIEIFQTALELDPTNADNWNNMGIAYGGLENPERAIECINKAIEFNPNQYLFLNNLALQYRALQDYPNAIAAMEKAIQVKEMPQLLVNLGGIYGEMKDVVNARRCFQRAVDIAPNYSAAHVDMAFAYHLEGKWQEGFEHYEWRLEYYPQLASYKQAYDQSKKWDGKASLEDKRILVYCEQGIGDTIQFARYFPQLKARGAHVIAHCPGPTIEPLIRRCPGVDEIVVRNIMADPNVEFPPYDYQCMSMSLPLLLNDFELRGEPYIEAPTERFREYIDKNYGNTLNIGVVWAGSPAHPQDKRRSIPLRYFRPLYELEGVKLFNLQMDLRPRQYGLVQRPLGSDEEYMSTNFKPEHHIVDYCEGCDDMSLVDLTPMIQNFEDTATILAGLDLVVCCDTATAHLAGAMGVPCWVAIPYNPDWRWLYDGETTGWYNSVRLFRQEKRDQWGEVFDRIRKELNETLLPNKRQKLS
jgi:hypothetical protein